MHFRQETERLNLIPIVKVARSLGVELPNAGSVRCPLPDHDDKSPSFSIYDSGLRWRCFVCDKGGGSIDLVRHFLGIPFLDAKKWLAETQSVSAPSTSRPKQALANREDRSERAQESEPDFLLYQDFLQRNQIGDLGNAYLHGRGFQPNTIMHFSIGEVRNIDNTLRELDAQFGFERLKESGLLSKHSIPGDLRPSIPDGCILIPFFESGRVAYMQGRAISPSLQRRKWFNLVARRKRIFNADLITNTDRELWICESAFDAISAYELGWSAIGLLGLSFRPSRAQLQSLMKKNVKIVLDWDERGRKQSRALKATLATEGIRCSIPDAPDPAVKDLNEYLIKRANFR